MSQSHLVIDFPIKGAGQRQGLTRGAAPVDAGSRESAGRLGTVHFSRFMVEGDEKLLFLSDIDGESTSILSGRRECRPRV